MNLLCDWTKCREVKPDAMLLRRQIIVRVSKKSVLFDRSIRDRLGELVSLEIPDGALIMEQSFDDANRCFNLLVCHESFDLVPDGGKVPVVWSKGFK